MQKSAQQGTSFGAMKPLQKGFFILKLVVCVLTFGMAFPNVSDMEPLYPAGAGLRMLATSSAGSIGFDRCIWKPAR